MNLALAKNETGRALSDSFAIARDRLPGAGKVAEARSAAFEAYDRAGLPHRRIEDWKYTDLRALMRDVLPLRARAGCRCAEAGCHRLEASGDQGRAPAGAGGWRVHAKTVRTGRLKKA